MSKFKLTYGNGETEELDNLDQLTADQRSDVENGIAELTDENGDAVDLPEAAAEEVPATEGLEEDDLNEDEQ